MCISPDEQLLGICPVRTHSWGASISLHFAFTLMSFPSRRIIPLFSLCLGAISAPLLVQAAPATAPTHASVPAPVFLDDEAENSCDVSWTLAKPTAPWTMVFDWQDASNFYALEATPKGLTLSMTKAGRKTVFNTTPIAWSAKNTFVLQRRPWLMQVMLNDKIVARAFDDTWKDGQIGALPSSLAWSEARVQPVENVRFDDDFTRAGQVGDGTWKTVSGKWKLTASSEHISATNATMSSNPFAFEATAPGTTAFASNGRAFWDSYDARVSVRPAGTGQIGIAAYVKDPKNYLAFRWSSTDGPAARSLVRVENGRETVVASAPGAFLPRQWYQLGIRTSPGYVEAILDGVPILRIKNEILGQGGIGLWAKNIASVAFDDVEVRSYDFLRADFAPGGAWKPNKGTWNLANGAATSVPGEATLLTGANDWDGYRVSFSAQLKPNSALGVVTGWRDPKNYALTWLKGGHAQIIRVSGGVSKLLADVPAPLTPAKDGTVRLTASVQRGLLSLATGNRILVQTGGQGLTTGRFGLYSKSTVPVAFKEAVILFPPPPEPIKIAPKMVDDAYMVGWASATGEWPPTPTDKGLEFWNTGEFFGDASVNFPWRAVWRGTFEMALRSQRGKFDSGYILRGTVTDDRASILWTLLRGGKTLTSASVKMTDLPNATTEGAILRIDLIGNSVLLGVGNTPILSYLDPSPPMGTAIAARAMGFRVRADRMAATSANRDDYTFTEAPVDFYAPSGKWSVFSRWPCYGDWSFFGGTGRHPTLWSKRVYAGDQIAEMYSHPQMDLPKEPGYSHPGDLNISLCGDGKNPASGYSFIVAGDSNTRMQIRKGSQVVAERSDEAIRFQNTTNHDMRWHRRWFYIRVEAQRTVKNGKNGVLLALTLDDERLLEWFDPNPLPSWQKGGRVAFWTVDSTFMIARAKIEARTMGARSLPTGLMSVEVPEVKPVSTSPNVLKPAPVVEEGVVTAVVAQRDGVWTVTDPVAGGVFAVNLNTAPIQATISTKWEMEAQVPEDVKVDLYALIDDQWYTVKLTGNQKPDAMAPNIGQATRTSGTKPGFSKFRFDLGAALAKELPGTTSWKINALRIGAMHGDPYRWVGFGGNTAGDSYRIASVKIQ